MVKIALTKKQQADLDKAKSLAHSRLFSPFMTSESPHVADVVEELLTEYQEAAVIQRQHLPKYTDALRALILDLYSAFRSDPTVYLRYSRNRQDYLEGSGYKPAFLGADILIKLIDFLERREYVEHQKGYLDRDKGRGRRSRMRGTERLLALFDAHKVTLADTYVSQDEEVIILRDAQKQPLPFEETDETHRMRTTLQTINSYIQERTILLKLSDEEYPRFLRSMRAKVARDPDNNIPLDFTKVTLHRVFNGDFAHGGRFYGGWWQSVPRESRPYITINDKPTVEMDYSGLHVRMLYALDKKAVPEGDVYALGRPDDKRIRKLLKQVMLVMLNADDRITAIRAVRDAIINGKLKYSGYEKYLEGGQLKALMAALEEKHSDIREHFCQGRWGMLQSLDSDIAEQVMLEFIELDAVALPLHNSFIVYDGFQDHLKAAMEKAFFDKLGRPGEVDLKTETRRSKFRNISDQELIMNYTKYLCLLKEYNTKRYYLGIEED